MGMGLDAPLDAKGHVAFMRRAVQLALAAEEKGNLPVGAVIILDSQVVAEGESRILTPAFHPGRHAEIEALRSVPTDLWPQAAKMTCYTTLEPCLMCLGTLVQHGVGRVVFGAHDPLGGALGVLGHLPDYVAEKAGKIEWVGPLLPEVCDPLCERVLRRSDSPGDPGRG